MEKIFISELVLTLASIFMLFINVVYENRQVKKIKKRINIIEQNSKECENIFYNLINKKWKMVLTIFKL